MAGSDSGSQEEAAGDVHKEEREDETDTRGEAGAAARAAGTQEGAHGGGRQEEVEGDTQRTCHEPGKGGDRHGGSGRREGTAMGNNTGLGGSRTEQNAVYSLQPG